MVKKVFHSIITGLWPTLIHFRQGTLPTGLLALQLPGCKLGKEEADPESLEKRWLKISCAPFSLYVHYRFSATFLGLGKHDVKSFFVSQYDKNSGSR